MDIPSILRYEEFLIRNGLTEKRIHSWMNMLKNDLQKLEKDSENVMEYTNVLQNAISTLKCVILDRKLYRLERKIGNKKMEISKSNREMRDRMIELIEMGL